MKIAIATFADLPNPPVKGGAVESLIDDLCQVNEAEHKLSIDVFSIQDTAAAEEASLYKSTNYIFYKKHQNGRYCKKNIIWKLFKLHIPDKTMSELVKLINQNIYDYVIITSINYEMEYIFRKIHSKVIWYLHGDPLSVLSQNAVRRIASQCHAVITVSNFVNRRVVSVNPACKVLTVRNCTDIIPLIGEDAAEARHIVRKEFNIRDEDVLFTYIGRISPIKGILELVRAFMAANLSNATLLIVGTPSTDNERNYFERVQEIVNEQVVFSGYVRHDLLNRLYCATDCVVAPSICNEAAPLVALEAAACCKPLIATNIGGILEYADENTTLIDYDAHFENRLMEAMLKICDNCRDNTPAPKQENGIKQYYADFCKALQQIS